jgi:hypothetical protein
VDAGTAAALAPLSNAGDCGRAAIEAGPNERSAATATRKRRTAWERERSKIEKAFANDAGGVGVIEYTSGPGADSPAVDVL